jgi:uncharacterized UPF0160 family protein
VKRTRDPNILDTCDIVVDVGAVYEESKQRFDHHQRGFDQVFGHGFTTKLSSAGLIYKSDHSFRPRRSFAEISSFRHFGREIISSQLQLTADDPKVESLWLKLYRVFFPLLLCVQGPLFTEFQEFIEALDGVDNGISQYPNDIQPKYRNRTDLSSRVGWLNPAWNEPVDSQTVDVTPFSPWLRSMPNPRFVF